MININRTWFRTLQEWKQFTECDKRTIVQNAKIQFVSYIQMTKRKTVKPCTQLISILQYSILAHLWIECEWVNAFTWCVTSLRNDWMLLHWMVSEIDRNRKMIRMKIKHQNKMNMLKPTDESNINEVCNPNTKKTTSRSGWNRFFLLNFDRARIKWGLKLMNYFSECSTFLPRHFSNENQSNSSISTFCELNTSMKLKIQHENKQTKKTNYNKWRAQDRCMLCNAKMMNKWSIQATTTATNRINVSKELKS